MRDWGFAPSAEELEAVSRAAQLYRDHCASLPRLPTRAAFDGSIDDVRTLDFLAYESLAPRGAGIETAAMVCGEVLRLAAGLEWLISYRGDWFVASDEDSPHEIAICPIARLHELECGPRRGGGPGCICGSSRKRPWRVCSFWTARPNEALANCSHEAEAI